MSAAVLERAAEFSSATPSAATEQLQSWARAQAESAPALSSHQMTQIRSLFIAGGHFK